MRKTLAAITAVLAGCGGQATEERPTPEPAIQFQRASVSETAHGERLAQVLGCIGCHRDHLTGEDWSEPGFGRLWTANLTRAAARYSDAQLARVIRSGARPDGSELWEMPSHLFTHLTDADMDAVIAFVRSVPRQGPVHPLPVFEEAARREIAAGNLISSPAQVAEEGGQWPPDQGAGHALGRYIVRATCAECHRMNLAGGQPHPEAAPRPDLRIVVPAYDEAAFARLMRTGKALGDRELPLMSGVARGRYRYFTDEELWAVYLYLHAVAAVPE